MTANRRTTTDEKFTDTTGARSGPEKQTGTAQVRDRITGLAWVVNTSRPPPGGRGRNDRGDQAIAERQGEPKARPGPAEAETVLMPLEKASMAKRPALPLRRPGWQHTSHTDHQGQRPKNQGNQAQDIGRRGFDGGMAGERLERHIAGWCRCRRRRPPRRKDRGYSVFSRGGVDGGGSCKMDGDPTLPLTPSPQEGDESWITKIFSWVRVLAEHK